MKKTLVILFALTLVGVFAVSNCAQSRTNRIYRPCPSTTVTARVEVQTDGDIDLVPCVGRSVLINGSPTSNTITFSGTDRTNFFPVFSSETNLAKSPFRWDGSIYTWNNAAANIEFTLDFTPSTASGRFRVGDFTTTPTNYLTLDQSANVGQFVAAEEIFLDAPLAFIGDTVNADTWLVIDSAANRFTFANGDVNATVNFGSVATFQFLRTITAGGTTGNQTINRPSGTVNFAAAAAALTVTNSTVNASSIVLATARTNDATCSVKNVVAGAGSFVINMTAACTAATSVGFLVLN